MPYSKHAHLYETPDISRNDRSTKFGIGAPANHEVAGEIRYSSNNPYCCCIGAGAANKTEYKK